MKKSLLTLALMVLQLSAMAQHWTAKTTQDLPNETPVYVQLKVNGEVNPYWEIAAFVGDECRADAQEGNLTNNLYTLRVVGDLTSETNSNIVFRAYDSTTGLEYQFGTTIAFTGETYTPSPLVLNLDAITGIKLPATIEVNKPASAYPYNVDLSTYVSFEYRNSMGEEVTPMGESILLTQTTVEWQKLTESEKFSLAGNTLTIDCPEGDSDQATLLAVLKKADGSNVGQMQARTLVEAKVAAVAVSGITCNVTAIDKFYAYENLYDYLVAQGAVTISPADASNKGFHIAGVTTNLLDNCPVEAGEQRIQIIPDDESYTGEPAVLTVKVYVRPTNIAFDAENIEIGVGENVEGALLPHLIITYPSENIPEEYKEEAMTFSYAPQENAIIDTYGMATAPCRFTATATLTNGITPMAVTQGNDQASIGVVVVSRLSITWKPNLQNTFSKNGRASTKSPVYVYVENPCNEPFDATFLKVVCDENTYRFANTPYFTCQSVSPGTDPEGNDVYTFSILPQYAGNNILYKVVYTHNDAERGEWEETLDLKEAQPSAPVLNIINEQTLEEGWNWLGVSTGTEESDYRTALADAFTMDDIIEIRSQLALLYNDPTYGLIGSMDYILAENATYKVKTNKLTAATLGSFSVLKSSPLNKTLRPGYNWMPNPYEFDINGAAINTVLNSYAATEGDRIITKDAFMEYDGQTWAGSNNFVLKEGAGYVYYSAAAGATDMTLTDIEPAQVGYMPAPAKGRRVCQNSIFAYDAHAFADNMAMVVALDGIEDASDYTMGVFVGNECRGRGEFAKDNILFVNAAGKVGETFTLKLYNNLTGELSDLEGTYTYNLSNGSLKAPVKVKATGATTGLTTISSDRLNANNIYDLSGRRVEKATKGIYIVGGRKVLK